uniref:Pectinesterase catalytic domain-containing protein n=2 Tax=Aegilops tauschii subsp. strangulata TaxID=200361 RepID=A0A453D9R1_AEGTS
MDEITEMSHDGDRHLSETMDQIDEMSHNGDRHLSETMDQIDEMSHKGDRHLSETMDQVRGYYIYTCADGFDKPELKHAMDKLLRNSTELSSNALAIITRVGQFLHQGQDAKSDSTGGGSRRLLGWYMGDAHDVESRRRLLAINGRLDEIAVVRDASRRLLSETMDEITEMSHDGDRHLSETMDQIDEMSHNGDRHLSETMDQIDEMSHDGDRHLSETMDQIDEMSHDGDRHLQDVSTSNLAGNVSTSNLTGKANTSQVMSFGDGSSASMFFGVSNLTKEADFVRRRLLSMTYNGSSENEVKQYGEGNKRRLLNDPSSEDEVKQYAEGNKRRLLNDASSGDEVKQYGEGNKRRLLNDASSGDEVKQYGEGNKRRLLNDASSDNEVKQYGEGNKRRLLNDALSDNEVKQYGEGNKRRLLNDGLSDNEVKQYGEGNRRKLLSSQMQIIADMSAQMNRRLLATELPEDLAGKRQLLSNKLVMIYEVAKEANCELEAIGNGSFPEEEDQRVLATEVVGTIEDLPNSHRRKLLSAGVFPEWVSSHTRRLLQIPGGLQKPNAVVAADGSGNFKTITEALNSVPKKSTARFVIYVKAGEYKEYVTVSKDQANVFMYGDGPTKTRVIGDKSNKGGFATIATRTFSAEGNGFICKSMGFVNTAGPDGHQAVALHVQGDMSVFFNCRFEGYQDTLYVHANRQFFRNCEVLGTIDFIFGNSAAVFQNCLMTVRKPMESQGNMVTAHGRTDPNMPTGIVLQGCKIVPEDALFPVRQTVPSYLGRPWKEYSRTVIMESTIGDLIKPEGWSEWMGDLGLKTLYYAEYANTGPGAGTSKRVTWPGYRVIGQAEATQFTAGVFIDGMSWLKNTGTPNVMGFIK